MNSKIEVDLLDGTTQWSGVVPTDLISSRFTCHSHLSRPSRRRRSVGVANATQTFLTVPSPPFGSTTATPDNEEDQEEEGAVVWNITDHFSPFPLSVSKGKGLLSVFFFITI